MTAPVLFDDAALGVNKVYGWAQSREGQPPLCSKIERILCIPPGPYIVVIDVDCSKSAWPEAVLRTAYIDALQCQRLFLLENDPHEFFHRPPLAYESQHAATRDERWDVIQDMLTDPDIYNPSKRTVLVEEAVKNGKASRTMIYRYLRWFWQRGQIKNALLPDYRKTGNPGKKQAGLSRKRGRMRTEEVLAVEELEATDDERQFERHGIPIGPKERNIFEAALTKYRLEEKLSLSKAFDRLLHEYYYAYHRVSPDSGALLSVLLPPERRPSLKQFLYYYRQVKAQDPERFTKAEQGERKYNLTSRPRLGNAVARAFAPGSLFEIDAHFCDCHLVHPITRMPIGRPTLYLVVDVFSRIVVGLCVTLERPSYIGAALALENAFSDKVAFCASFGITISPEDWPCKHVCHALVADRGELIGKMATDLVSRFKLRLDNLPPYRADMKGLVENHFKITNDMVTRYLPGHIDCNRERGDKNPLLEAALDLHAYTQIMIRCALVHTRRWLDDYNLSEFMIADGTLPRPLDLWKWGFQNRSRPAEGESKAVLREKLLPRAVASVSRDGIYFHGLFYICPEGVTEHWFVKRKKGKGLAATVVYDPRLVDAIYVCRKDTEQLVLCHLKEGSTVFTGWSWGEVAKHRTLLRAEKNKQLALAEQNRVDFDAEVGALIASEIAKTQSARDPQMSKASLLAGRNANRTDANKEERGRDPWIGGSIPAALPNVIPLPDVASTPTSSPLDEDADPDGQHDCPAEVEDPLVYLRAQRDRHKNEGMDRHA